MSEAEINIMLDKDRVEVQSSKGRKVLIKAVDDNSTKLFDSISSCITYLNSIAPSNKTTLYRHFKSGKPYHGYICEWVSELTTPIVDVYKLMLLMYHLIQQWYILRLERQLYLLPLNILLQDLLLKLLLKMVNFSRVNTK